MAKETCYQCEIQIGKYPEKKLTARVVSKICSSCGYGFCRQHFKEHDQGFCGQVEAGSLGTPAARRIRRKANPRDIGRILRMSEERDKRDKEKEERRRKKKGLG